MRPSVQTAGIPCVSAGQRDRVPIRPLPILAGVVAPPLCPCCAGPRGGGEAICGGCGRALAACPARLEPGPPGVELACAVGPYEGVIRELVVALKFRRLLGVAAVAARAMAGACPERPLRGELVPVPAAPLRRRWRGFDPAEELALALASCTGLPLTACLRRKQGPRQMGRPRAVRLADGPQVELRAPAPSCALLVDDVHTTGATLASSARALRSGDCREVVALTLARA